MSDTTADPRTAAVNMDDVVAETHKLVAESAKFVAEAAKLNAEERKLRRDASVAPWQISVAAIGGIAGAVAAAITAARALGFL
jgi:hypothetical protein